MKVLIAYDGGEAGNRALAAMHNWATSTQPEIHLITVIRPGDVHDTTFGRGTHALTPAGTESGQMLNTAEPVPAMAESRSQAVASALSEAEERLYTVATRALPGLDIHVHTDINERVAEAIIATGVRLDVELIAVGTHGRTGIGHALMGSVAERIIRQSPIPVLVVGPRVGEERPD
ncbi:MAG: universal stress protein [Dehalococcoidia bacterium]|nr:universal stress protein [Dehalococcoidia bacterium]